MVGQTIAHYRVTAKLGEGGMGEVYRATDTKLGRDVALKVLPAAFAEDEQRMARFQREAQLLASLNHPNIAAIYGLEEQAGAASGAPMRALAMELVEGPTLAERIAQGAIPWEEALPIAKQIAEALEYAHEKGIIHRDLKPANIKLTNAGQAKILDFGLAKALAEDPVAQDMSASPTLSVAATKAGFILGTAAYMSPEQARGKSADRRADIWSFGVVLYEMFTGSRAFAGEDVSITLANVIKEDPDWKKLPASTPQRIRELLQRCLMKDARQRLQAIGEARFALEKASTEPQAATQTPSAVAPAKAAWIPWAVSAALLLVTGVALVKLWRQAPRTAPTRRFSVMLPSGQTFFGPNPVIAISPDGAQVVYGGSSISGVGWRLMVRPLDEGAPKELPEEAGSVPFFSWDGQWVGYFTPGKLKKVRVNGGMPEVLADVRATWGASWGPDDTIVYSPDFTGGLWKVSARGGTPQEISSNPDVMQRWPHVLPDGKHVLCAQQRRNTGGFDSAKVTSVFLETGEAKELVDGTNPVYVSSGHILFARNGGLFAVPFDADRQEITGEIVQIVSGVRMSSDGIAYFSASREGTLVYLPSGVATEDLATLVRVDRKGNETAIGAPPRAYTAVRLSPDGKGLAGRLGGANTDIWAYSLERGALSRLTFRDGEDESPVWSGDGRKVAYSSQLTEGRILFWKNADGSGAEETLWKGGYHTHASSISRENKFLLFTDYGPLGKGDIWVLPLEGERKPRPFLQTPANEFDGRFSPDGKWVAYSSDESGQLEVYITAFPGPGGKWQVSTGGADSPVWSPNGRELFFRSQKKIMKVDVSTSPTFSLSAPHPLFDSIISELARREANYDVFPDGQHFLVVKASNQRNSEYHVVLNFDEELKRLAPPGKK